MYSRIVNPKTGRRISITGKLGKTILRNYINILMGGSASGGSDADEPPVYYIGPITSMLMVDPVITSDGDSYERAAIEQWFSDGNDTSPRTDLPLLNQSLIPNNTLRRAIEGWKEQYTERHGGNSQELQSQQYTDMRLQRLMEGNQALLAERRAQRLMESVGR